MLKANMKQLEVQWNQSVVDKKQKSHWLVAFLFFSGSI
jgi:hypothetical protein